MATFNLKIKAEPEILVVDDGSKSKVALQDFLISEILILNKERNLNYPALIRELDASYLDASLENFNYEESENPCLIIDENNIIIWNGSQIAGKYSFSDLEKREEKKFKVSIDNLVEQSNDMVASVVADTESFLLNALSEGLSNLTEDAKGLLKDHKLDLKSIEVLKDHLKKSVEHLDQILDYGALKATVEESIREIEKGVKDYLD